MGTYDDEIAPGDIVAVRHGFKGRTEGLVIGSYLDYKGRQVIEVQLDDNLVRMAFPPEVTRVRRTLHYSLPGPHRTRTVERRVYW